MEASVFVLASGEETWWVFDQEIKSHKALPILPCDDVFKYGDKESLCAGTHLLVCEYEIDGPVIWTYDLIMNVWCKGPSMIEPRCLFASASCGDFAFVAGGVGLDLESNHQVPNSVEKYDHRTKSWDPMPKMKVRRKMCSAVHMDNKLYVIGGQNQNGDILSCAEVFHEERNMWEHIPGMLNGCLTLATSQSPPHIAVLNNELYLFETFSNSLIVYLKANNSWKNLGPVPVRSDINKGWGVAFKSLGNQLLVIGNMTAYTCFPNLTVDTLNWKLVSSEGGNVRGHFIMNCTVMLRELELTRCSLNLISVAD